MKPFAVYTHVVQSKTNILKGKATFYNFAENSSHVSHEYDII